MHIILNAQHNAPEKVVALVAESLMRYCADTSHNSTHIDIYAEEITAKLMTLGTYDYEPVGQVRVYEFPHREVSRHYLALEGGKLVKKKVNRAGNTAKAGEHKGGSHRRKEQPNNAVRKRRAPAESKSRKRPVETDEYEEVWE